MSRSGSSPEANLEASRSTPTGEDHQISKEPSIVINMGMLGDEDAPEEIDESMFAPLSGNALRPSQMPIRSARNAPSLKARPVEDLQVIRPPSVLNLIIYLIIFSVAGVIGYVAYANRGAPTLWQDPLEAISIAFKLSPPPPPPQVQEKEKIVEDVMIGELEVQGVGLRLVEVGRNQYAAVIDGMVANVTNRVQKAIFLEVSVSRTPGGLPHRSRSVACCSALTEPEALEIAKDPEHAHFSKRLRASDLRLQPMDNQSFTVIIPDIDKALKEGGLFPAVRIKGSESERPK